MCLKKGDNNYGQEVQRNKHFRGLFKDPCKKLHNTRTINYTDGSNNFIRWCFQMSRSN